MNTRIHTTAVRHSCVCGRLLAIQIAHRLIIKHRSARSLAGGGARLTCGGCKRPSTFTSFDIRKP
jgi:hypothetical protein